MSRQATKEDLQTIARAAGMPFQNYETTVRLVNRLVDHCRDLRRKACSETAAKRKRDALEKPGG